MTYNLRKYGTFLIFVLLAFTLWFVYRYQDVYAKNTIIFIEFTNVPDHILFDNNGLVPVELVLQSSGFNLLKASYFPPTIPLDYSLSTTMVNDELVLDLKNNLQNLSDNLNGVYSIERLNQDYIALPVRILDRKKIKLHYDPEVVFENNLVLIEKNFVDGDSIMISGDVNLLKTIDSIRLDNQRIVINDSLQKMNINIQNKLPEGVTSSTSEVVYEVRSTQMTEGVMELKVIITDVPEDVAIKTIPSTVSVTYTVPLSSYNSIIANDFYFKIPFDQLTESENIIPVMVKSTNDEVHSVRTVPSQIKILVIR